MRKSKSQIKKEIIEKGIKDIQKYIISEMKKEYIEENGLPSFNITNKGVNENDD